jgi:hypothetical protein
MGAFAAIILGATGSGTKETASTASKRARADSGGPTASRIPATSSTDKSTATASSFLPTGLCLYNNYQVSDSYG